MSIYKSFSIENRPGSAQFIQGAEGTKAWKDAEDEILSHLVAGNIERYRDFLIRVLQENHWEPPACDTILHLKGLSERVAWCMLMLHFANKKLSFDVTVN